MIHWRPSFLFAMGSFVRLFDCFRLFVCLFVRLGRLSLCALKAEAGYTLSQVLVDVRRQLSPAMCVWGCGGVCVSTPSTWSAGAP